MRKVVGVVLSCLLLLLSSTHSPAAQGWEEIGAEGVKKMMDEGSVTVINPLSKIEFNDLAIKGSVNIPFAALKSSLPADRESRLVFYCLGPK